MKKHYPEHALWDDPLFHDPEYEAFAKLVEVEIISNPAPPSTLSQVAPAIENGLTGVIQTVATQGNKQTNELNEFRTEVREHLGRLESKVDGFSSQLANSQRQDMTPNLATVGHVVSAVFSGVARIHNESVARIASANASFSDVLQEFTPENVISAFSQAPSPSQAPISPLQIATAANHGDLQPNDPSDNIPVYFMNRKITSVVECWKEYKLWLKRQTSH
ncbi:hypothetical protein BC829DRAFT_480900 [Chytridium lagenaria]|nr:hypothetical protein BC829DRAFT_480900 [Chytridium lagenaria]